MKRSVGAKTLAYPTPVFVVGTYDESGKPNAAAVAWGGICCSRPPCIAVSLRMATHTHGSIKQREAFTVNIPSEEHIREADYFGIASGRDTDKISIAGLTAKKSDLVDAPYIEEFPLIIECRLLQTVEIGLHTQFIGEIMDVKAEESILEGQLPHVKKANPCLFTPDTQEYYSVGRILAKAFSVGRELIR